jgi:S1-C subfamily serine protease
MIGTTQTPSKVVRTTRSSYTRSTTVATRRFRVQGAIEATCASRLGIDHTKLKNTFASVALATALTCLVSLPCDALTDPVVVETQSAPSLEDQRVSDIYKNVDLSVVHIYDATVPGQLSGGSQAGQEGNGSGFVYNSAGAVVTNYHVLAKAIDSVGIQKLASSKTPIARVVVIVDGGSRHQAALPAYVVGADKARDLLVLQLVPTDDNVKFYPARLGDSSDVRVGSTILAFGTPFGFEHSVSKGIVSATNRGFQSYTDSTISGAFQIDAATNPGNSGGPVVDLDGEVVGVNTAIFTNTGVSSRIGFAIPSNTVKVLVDEILEFGEVQRASLGIKPAADNVRQSLNVQDGVLVQSVDPKGPSDGILRGASRGVGGIVSGDVIVMIDGKEVHGIFDLNQQLDEKHVGDTVKLGIKRAGKAEDTVTVQVKLAKE